MEAIKTRYLIPAWELSRNEIQLREQTVVSFISQEYKKRYGQKPIVRQLKASDLGWTSWETPVIGGPTQYYWQGDIKENVAAITGILQLTPWPWHTGELEIFTGNRRTYYVDLTMLQLSFKKNFADMLAKEMGLDILMLIAGDDKYSEFFNIFSNLRCEGFFSGPIIIEPFNTLELRHHLSPQAPGPGKDMLMLRGYVADLSGMLVA